MTQSISVVELHASSCRAPANRLGLLHSARGGSPTQGVVLCLPRRSRLTSSTVGFTVGMAHRRDPVGDGELCVWRYPLLYEDAAASSCVIP